LLVVFAFGMLIMPAATAARDSTTPRPGGGGNGRWRNTAPVLTITNPSNLETVAGTVLITATAVDAEDGALTAMISIDGVVVGTNSYSWDTTSATEGTHSIVASATDLGGLTGSSSIAVIVDNVEDPPPPPGQNK